jgi:hypothetical protein
MRLGRVGTYQTWLKYSDSVTEKESLKSIQNDTNDIFLELQEKVSAVFNA